MNGLCFQLPDSILAPFFSVRSLKSRPGRIWLLLFSPSPTYASILTPSHLQHTLVLALPHTHTHGSCLKVLTGSFSSLRSYSSKRLSLTPPKVAPPGYSVMSSSHVTSCEGKHCSLHANLLSRTGLSCLFMVCKYIQNAGPSHFPP